MTRFLSFALCAVLLTAGIAASAASRSIEVFNGSGYLIDVGFLQPPESHTLHSYGTIHDRQDQIFDLPDRATGITLRSSGCHGYFHYTLPMKSHVRVMVLKGCKISAN